MIYNLIQNQLDTFDAKIILDKGWRQGSIFHPGDVLNEIVIADGELLIICTQSCTVVSSRYTTDPIVEAMIVKTFAKYNPNTFEATGKNQRKLHLEVTNNSQIKCIECDINRRFFFDRQHLLRITPLQEIEIGKQGIGKLAGWLGRSYTRIALPDSLIERMRPEVFPFLLKALNEKQADGPKKSSPLHESVSFTYIDWQPRSELPNPIEIRFIFICNDANTEALLESLLVKILKLYLSPEGKNGIKIVDMVCHTPDTTLLSDLIGFERFSEWDFLSELVAIAYAPPNLEYL